MMKKYLAIISGIIMIVPLVLSGIVPAPATLAEEDAGGKISSILKAQVEAKLDIKENGPLADNEISVLRPMLEEGQGPSALTGQKVYIYCEEKPDSAKISELEAMGLTVYPDTWIPPVMSHPAGFLQADMPLDKLDEVAVKDYVVRLDTAERVFYPHNDAAVQKMNVDDVWSSGYNGTGVTVAVLDSGLDVTHADIPAPVDSHDYAEDDATIANTVTGHGTHVTGSVLGRAWNTTGSTYNGTAPGASLVFLKIGSDATGGASSGVIVDALHGAVDTYNADIITMSYGGWSTWHDGSEAEAQAVDYAVSQGAVVLISAGNEGNDAQHYSGTVAASSTTDYIQVTCNVTTLNTIAFAYNMVWYDGTGTSNDLELAFYDPSKSLLASTDYAVQDESTRGTESQVSYHNTSYLPVGTYSCYLKVINNSTNSQTFHLYYSSIFNGSSYWPCEFNSPDPAYTLSSPADADSAIAVGAYTTRTGWYDFENGGWTYGETLDQISSFSSRGPRVDTSTTPKVNIVAPGSAIISARDSDVYPWTPGGGYGYDAYVVDNNGPNRSNAGGGSNDTLGPADYYVMQGTSMACPHAAGVAALILDKNSSWTPAQVRHALEYNAVDKGSAGFDPIYGFGLVHALNAVNSSLPVTASYSDASHTTPCDEYNDFGTEHTVYMYATSLLESHNYRVAYYDGGNTKRATDDVAASAGGILESQHTFVNGVDVAGPWKVLICEPEFTPSNSYNGSWSYIITSDNFSVTNDAIPEFPTVAAAVLAFGICAAVYFGMRRKAAPVTA
jgi:subtilisin family serine protease